jgi:DNA-binding LytR/AlgR family response regulator
MKIHVQESEQCTEMEVHILCRQRDEEVMGILEFLTRGEKKIPAHKERKQTVLLAQQDIFYVESVDKRTFIYQAEQVYECDARLYQLEERLMQTHFFRISKSMLVNITKVQSIEPEGGRRLKIVLENGERLLVSRQYVREFKTKLGIK